MIHEVYLVHNFAGQIVAKLFLYKKIKCLKDHSPQQFLKTYEYEYLETDNQIKIIPLTLKRYLAEWALRASLGWDA